MHAMDPSGVSFKRPKDALSAHTSVVHASSSPIQDVLGGQQIYITMICDDMTILATATNSKRWAGLFAPAADLQSTATLTWL